MMKYYTIYILFIKFTFTNNSQLILTSKSFFITDYIEIDTL